MKKEGPYESLRYIETGLLEQFADHVRVVSCDRNPSVRIELAIFRNVLCGANQFERVVVSAARLALTPNAAVQLHKLLGIQLAALEQNGSITRDSKAESGGLN